MATVPLNLPHHQYVIHIDLGGLDRLGAVVHEVAPHDRCALFHDAALPPEHARRALDSLAGAGFAVTDAPVAMGEHRKTLDTVRKLYDILLDDRLERRSPVIALGGGVLGDTVGFVAATYLRGVPFIQAPTTLLAMVDASVGGKVGVNVPQGKNLIGAFHQPAAVVIDVDTLATLPARELRCGLAECVKHGVIRDPDLFAWLEDNAQAVASCDPQAMAELVRRNVAIKAAVVEEDEKESGVRAHLNFGHTFAHAIEATAGYGEILHGEAVSLGMVAATRLSVALGRTDPALADRLTALLDRIGLPTRADIASTADLMAAMHHDKKVADGRLVLVLPDRMGQVSIVKGVPASEIEAAWATVR